MKIYSVVAAILAEKALRWDHFKVKEEMLKVTSHRAQKGATRYDVFIQQEGFGPKDWRAIRAKAIRKQTNIQDNAKDFNSVTPIYLHSCKCMALY